MTHEVELTHEFVEQIPEQLKERTLYVSIPFATVLHKCCCGCGREVVTPLSPVAWSLGYNGKTISLYPSIGNWTFPCRSHYWIEHNKAVWAPQWSQDQIEAGRACEAKARERYFGKTTVPSSDSTSVEEPTRSTSKKGFWRKVKQRFRGSD